jgi:hypothetical protein
MYIVKGKIFNFLNGACNEDLTLILRKKMEIFADTSAFNFGVKEKNTKTNKQIVKNQRMNSHEPCI